jgi:hypothetical protein
MWSYVLTGLLLAANPQVEVQTFAGRAESGEFVALTADKFTLTRDGKQEQFPLEDLLSISIVGPAVAPPSGAVEVTLVDGSTLFAKDYQAAGGKATLTLYSGEKLTIATQDLSRVRTQALNEILGPQWEKLVDRERSTDVLVVRKEDSLDHLEGVMHDVNDRWEFDPGGGMVRARPEKVFGVLFFQKAGRTLGSTVCVVTDQTGAQFSVARFTLENGPNGQQVKFSTPAGTEMVRPLDKLVRFDFSKGKVQYLSDLKPLANEHTAFFGGAGSLGAPPKLDKAIDGGLMTLEGKTFNKGLAIRPKTQLVYRLGREFRRFQATLGIDDSVGARGHALVTVRGDEKVLFEGEVSGADKPRSKSLDLDVTGIHKLEITVDFGKQLDVGDHVDFASARIIK